MQGSLATVLAGMERERLRALVQLVLRRFSVDGYGGPRNCKGRVTAYQFTPEFQELWLAHSQRMVAMASGCVYQTAWYSEWSACSRRDQVKYVRP